MLVDGWVSINCSYSAWSSWSPILDMARDAGFLILFVFAEPPWTIRQLKDIVSLWEGRGFSRGHLVSLAFLSVASVRNGC